MNRLNTCCEIFFVLGNVYTQQRHKVSGHSSLTPSLSQCLWYVNCCVCNEGTRSSWLGGSGLKLTQKKHEKQFFTVCLLGCYKINVYYAECVTYFTIPSTGNRLLA